MKYVPPLGHWSVQKRHNRAHDKISLPEATTTVQLRLHFTRQDFGVSVDRGHEAEAHGSANRLGNLALVDGPEASLVAVLDAS